MEIPKKSIPKYCDIKVLKFGIKNYANYTFKVGTIVIDMVRNTILLVRPKIIEADIVAPLGFPKCNIINTEPNITKTAIANLEKETGVAVKFDLKSINEYVKHIRAPRGNSAGEITYYYMIFVYGDFIPHITEYTSEVYMMPLSAFSSAIKNAPMKFNGSVRDGHELILQIVASQSPLPLPLPSSANLPLASPNVLLQSPSFKRTLSGTPKYSQSTDLMAKNDNLSMDKLLSSINDTVRVNKSEKEPRDITAFASGTSEDIPDLFN